ncbi:MAG: hypothetical protein ACI4CA_05940 [Bacteroides sp.]
MRTYRQLAMGLLALLLCIALPSCSDDDDENEKKEAVLEEQKGMVELLNLQMNLCLMNLEGEPTEATFGLPLSQANTAERIYYTKDLNSAKKRYQLLFHSDTKCSEDGNTYTLANKQGTATFAEASGNKGELAVATFDVPGLKGLVKKVHFIDYTQRGENIASWEEFENITLGDIVGVKMNDNTYRYGIALGKLKDSDDTWVLFTPSFSKDLYEYGLTGFIDQTMIDDELAKINIMDYFQSYTEGEFQTICSSVWNFFFDGTMECADANESWHFVKEIYCTYWEWESWNNTGYFFQVQNETVDYESYFNIMDFQNYYSKTIYNRYHMLLDTKKYESRTKLWNLPRTTVYNANGTTTTQEDIPDEFALSLALWTTISTVTKGEQIKILF